MEAEDAGTGGRTGARGAAFRDDWSETVGRLVGGREEGVADGLEVFEEGELRRVDDVLEAGSEATFCCDSAPTIVGWFIY